MRVSEQTRIALADEVYAGASVAETAAKHGIHTETVRAICKERGVRIRSSKVDPRLMLDLALGVAQGMPVRDVAKRHKVGIQAVRRACVEYEIRIPKSHFSAEERVHALELVDALGSAEAAARVIGASPSRVAAWCRKAGVSLEPGNMATRRARAKDDEVVALLEEGYGNREIKELTGLSAPSVTAIAKREGIVRSPGRKKPIELRELDELDARAAEIVALASITARTKGYRESEVAQYLSWCEVNRHDPSEESSFALYVRHLAQHGRSGRPGTFGQRVGCAFSTIVIKARAVAFWNVEQGRPDFRSLSHGKAALEWAQQNAPTASNARRRLKPEEIEAMAEVPAPVPTRKVLLSRLTLLAAAGTPDVDPVALSWSLCASSTSDVTLSNHEAIVALAPHRSGLNPDTVSFTHVRGGLITCGHCVLSELWHRLGKDEPLGGVNTAQAAWEARKAVSRTIQRLAIETISDRAEFERVLWHLDRSLVRWVRRHAYTATLRSTGWRGDEVRRTDVADIDIAEGRYLTFMIRRRKNDQFGKGLVARIDAEHSSGTAFWITLWLALRGPVAGALFSNTGAPLAPTTLRTDLRTLAAAAGVDLHRFGGHGFRKSAVSELLERDVLIKRVAGRIGIAPQTALEYFEALTGKNTTELLGFAA